MQHTDKLRTKTKCTLRRRRISIMTNLPIEFENRMKRSLGDEYEAFLEAFEKNDYKALRINSLKISKEDFLKLNIWNITEKNRVEWCEDGFYFDTQDTDYSPGKHPYHWAGLYYIQEPSAMSPVEYLDVKPGDVVLDLCAAPGGKSTQIAVKLKGEGMLVSNEPVAARAGILSENIERLGIANAIVVSELPERLSDKLGQIFDRILVDAPCSGEGMFRKNSEAIDEWSEDNVLMCAKRQQDILDEALKMLKPGGRLVYSTCTFSENENEKNAEYVTDNFPDMKLVFSRRLWPHKDRGEGHFFAVFDKNTVSGAGDDYEINDSNGRHSSKNGHNKKDNSRKNNIGVDKKMLSDWYGFKSSLMTEAGLKKLNEEGKRYLLFKDELYLIPDNMPALDGIKVLRSGLHLGTLKKGRFEPSFSLALYLNPEDCVNNVNLSFEETLKYRKGETIQKEGNKGWNLLNLDGYSVGWGKVSDGIVKNHYPKGLRK